MDTQQERWNKYYRDDHNNKRDDWLLSYESLFRLTANPNILDLGCGDGSNIEFLKNYSSSIYACDYSDEAIKSLEKKYDIFSVVSDIRNQLPYEDNFFDIVVADLSLHFFQRLSERLICKTCYFI